MQRRTLLARTVCAAAALAAFAACSERTTAQAAPTATSANQRGSAQSYAAAAKGHGFTVGPLMAANTVYVFFDTACPHCAHLWQNSQPLLHKIKMVWMPVGVMRRQSALQGATILQSANPAAAMTESEGLLLAGKGGIQPAADLKPEVLDQIKRNTELFSQLGEGSVPLVLLRNSKSGEYVQFSGATSTEQLAAMIGL